MSSDSIRLLSVVHTGTHFLMDLFKANGIDNYSHCHYGVQTPIITQELIVSPIRDPWACYVTCISRGHLDDSFWMGWREFNARFLFEGDLWIVPVDTDSRGVLLSLLSLRLGVPLITDWKPVRSGPRLEVEPVDLSEIYNLPVVKKFYSHPEIN